MSSREHRAPRGTPGGSVRAPRSSVPGPGDQRAVPDAQTAPLPGRHDLPWKATAERRDLWGPAQRPLSGTVLPRTSKALAGPRQRGRWLTRGVPTVLGITAGLTLFTLFGIASLIGGGGLLWPLLAGIGAGSVVGGGAAFLLRNRRPSPRRLGAAGVEIPAGTRAVLEQLLRATTAQRRRVVQLRRRSTGPAAKPVLARADALLARIDALLGSEAMQSRRPSDGTLMMLDGMSTRYIPELLDAAEHTIGFLASVQGGAREEALKNLASIDTQLAVLGESVERIEGDAVSGVSRSLAVHHEFLKTRLADQHRDPIIDV